MAKIITHPGVVTSSQDGHVAVQMRVVSACSACQAHGKCGFAESKDKTFSVATREWQQYHVGDRVTVIIQSGNGLKAVFIAYVLPGLLLLGSFIGFYLLHIGDGLTALLSLLVVGLYGLLLYLIRNKLQQKFTLQLRKGS